MKYGEKMMSRIVILNSFHSQSPSFLANYNPEAIITFDSHPDAHMSGGPKSYEASEKLTVNDRDAL
jgi:hypothetical protein